MILSVLKNKIPWQLKITIKLIISRLPFDYSVWSKISIFKHGQMKNIHYVYSVTLTHYINFKNLNDKKKFVALEIGPGDSLLSAIVLYALGAKKVYFLDSGSYASFDFLLYKNMIAYLENRGFDMSSLKNLKSTEDILQKVNAVYLTEGINSLKTIQNSEVDMIFSQAVLEHIWLSDFNLYLKELKRIMDINGVSTHEVDLKDHLGGSLNNLRIRNRVWESGFFKNSGFYTNRIRYYEMLRNFKDTGFKINCLEKTEWKFLPIKLSKLQKKYQKLSLNDLRVSGFKIVMTK